MNRPVVIVLTGMIACAGLGSAQARPAYPGILETHYKDSEAIVAKAKNLKEKCNLCHVEGKPKKEHNEFGTALSKQMPKAQFMKLKDPADKEKLAKRLGEALKATEAEKHSSGKTFGEVIKAGKLPGEK